MLRRWSEFNNFPEVNMRPEIVHWLFGYVGICVSEYSGDTPFHRMLRYCRKCCSHFTVNCFGDEAVFAHRIEN